MPSLKGIQVYLLLSPHLSPYLSPYLSPHLFPYLYPYLGGPCLPWIFPCPCLRQFCSPEKIPSRFSMIFRGWFFPSSQRNH
jgi:hypothetical protein